MVRRAADGSVIGYQGIIRDVTERKRMEKELRSVRSMAAGFVAIEDGERRRIAVDLHDRVGQTLIGVADEDRSAAAGGREKERQALLDGLQGLLDRMDGELRTLIFELSPPVLHDFGLLAGLRWLAGKLETEHGPCGCAWKARGTARSPMRACALRCSAAFASCCSTSAATPARTRPWCPCAATRRELSLTVADRGRGFEPSPDTARHRLSFGLFSIGECLSQAGGSFEIESAPEQGTRCLLIVPSSSLGGKGLPMTARVVLVDDHELVRDGLRALFARGTRSSRWWGKQKNARTRRWSRSRPAGRTS